MRRVEPHRAYAKEAPPRVRGARSGSVLPDRVGPGTRVLLVGINPGMRSAALGHHFAGYSNHFWKLLQESDLVPEGVGYGRDAELPYWGLGITNLVARATPGVADLQPAELQAGRRTLARKIARWRPEVVALVGVTVFRSVFGVRAGRVRLGLQDEAWLGARVFVLPNPSGRNAHYSHADMLACFRALKEHLGRGGDGAGVGRRGSGPSGGWPNAGAAG